MCSYLPYVVSNDHDVSCPHHHVEEVKIRNAIRPGCLQDAQSNAVSTIFCVEA